MQTSTTPLVINHTSSFSSVTVSPFNLATNMSMSDAVREVGPDYAATAEYAGNGEGLFAGTAAASPDFAGCSEPILVATAPLAVYIVLGILYRELSVHPLDYHLHIAVSERGSDACVDGVQDRSECDFRSSASSQADRHCGRRMRISDDRLRAGGGTDQGKTND